MKNILKGLLKTATQIVKIGDFKNILGNTDYIGTAYFGVKRDVIKVLDNLYSKRSEEVKELDYNRLVPTTIGSEYEEVKEINIKVNTTQVVSESFLVYLNTSYYLFFSNYIKDLKMYVKSPVDPIILTSNNQVLGIVLPLRLKHELVLIPNNNIIAQNNILVDLKNIEIINPKELDSETRDITRQLQFDYYKKGLYAKYSYTRLNKLGFKLSHVNFEEAQTLEDYKKELEIKEQNKIKNNEYLQKLADEYIEYHNKSLSANQSNFNNIVNYTIEKINKVTYIVQCIDNNNNKIDYFRLNMLNCDVKLTEQKQIFKMIKEYLINSTLELQTIEEDKINDLKVEEVATTKEDIKENNNNAEVENVKAIEKANDLINSIDIKEGSQAQVYIDYLQSKNVNPKDSKNTLVMAARVHLVKFGSFKSDAISKAATIEGVKSTEELEKKYFNKLVELIENENNIYIDTREFTDNRIHDIKDYTVYTAPAGTPARGELKKFYDNNNNAINVSYNRLSRYKEFTKDQYNTLVRLQAAAEKQRQSGFSSRQKELYNKLQSKIEAVYNGNYNIKDVTIETITQVGGAIPSINKNTKDEIINKDNVINSKQVAEVVAEFKDVHENKLQMNLQALATPDPQIENWNNKLSTPKKIQRQLDTLKRIIIKRKADNNGLDLIPCNGFIISKLLQAQGHNVQYDRYKYIKCYYSIKESTPEVVVVAFKDSDNKLHYYTIKTALEVNQDCINMNLQLLASKQLKPIFNEDIKGHKEYQLQHLELYNSNVLNFNKKRINNKMIEEYTKYFIYKDNTFMSVPPAKEGSYPGGYYEHVRNYNYKIDPLNKVILFTDKEV